ncbi:hypothetical protein SYNTR_1035 [Candidatus Syntrophocurvum alkaliphilum]|uniref:MaoC-like domain-containing protein n=1 Tax=Candidatus Syntrophocurvum alkaliphilum TaxID=2293317 RepID=A0A6I6D9T7_9FIRM|nr:MaoC family dehydratase [Candidatus Syntrophocurvum alkaliphilum]QGT99628.1 hypothetical protein SYNTR_1035 [Candidatus Syntrophocurvum alkaliphilum]
MIENTYDELKVGDKSFIEKTITETDVYMYAGITGDLSWLHVNEKRAQKGHFKTRIVHGMLLAGFISNVIGNYLPGAGTIYQSQTLNFLKPCFMNDTIRAQVEIIEKLGKGRIKLKTACLNQNDEVILDGEAIVIPPRTKTTD